MDTKYKIKGMVLGAAIIGAVATAGVISAKTARTELASEVNVQNVIKQKKNLLHTQLDAQGRPFRSTFIGNDGFQEGKRVGTPEEPLNLKGKWKNQVVEQNGKTKKYLWDRGHLVGNQFAGYPSNDATNIVGETSYTNQKLMTYFEGGMKASNKNALDNWLYLHPNYFIDYTVTANYNGINDQYPRSVTLRFRGLDKKGNSIRIKLPDANLEGIGKQVEEDGDYTSVTIDNIYPGYQIDYVTGEAVKESDAEKNNRDTIRGADYTKSDTTGVVEGDKLEKLRGDIRKAKDESVKMKDRVSKENEDPLSWLIDSVTDFFKKVVNNTTLPPI